MRSRPARGGDAIGRSAAAAGSAAVAAAVATVVPRLGLAALTRQNFRGRPVSLAGGLGAAAGSVLGAAAGDRRRAALVLGASAAAAGLYDDLVAPRVECPGDKGWHGHLRALRAGRPTGGVVKIVLVGGGALLATRESGQRASTWLGRAALVAGAANLLNLLDLRPGRAAKVAVLAGTLGMSGPAGTLGAAAAGAAAGILPGDLAERTMLGDTGANTLGALLGLRLAAAGPSVRVVAGVVVAGLTVAAERVSLSAVIDRTPVLARLDRWGRRP